MDLVSRACLRGNTAQCHVSCLSSRGLLGAPRRRTWEVQSVVACVPPVWLGDCRCVRSSSHARRRVFVPFRYVLQLFADNVDYE